MHSRPRHPQSQGLIENFNSYIKRYLALNLATKENKEKKVSDLIKEIVLGYNERIHSVTKYRPIQLHYDRSLWKIAKERIDSYYNAIRQRTEKIFNVGSYVGACYEVALKVPNIIVRKNPGLAAKGINITPVIGIIENKVGSLLEIRVFFSVTPSIIIDQLYFIDSCLVKVLEVESVMKFKENMESLDMFS